MNSLKIGIDFDGVIIDGGKLKAEGGRRLFGLDIPPRRFRKELILGKGILTEEQYRQLQKEIYETKTFGLMMEPVPGALDYVPRLMEEGHQLSVITSRGQSAIAVAEEWMKGKSFYIPIKSASYGRDKTEACRGLDVYIDDDLDKLEKLVRTVPNRYFFRTDCNSHVAVDPSVAHKIYSWQQFYLTIKKIEKKH